MKYIIGHDRTQLLLIPDCLEYQISQDNEIRIMVIFVDSLKQKSAHIRPLLFGLNQTQYYLKFALKALYEVKILYFCRKFEVFRQTDVERKCKKTIEKDGNIENMAKRNWDKDTKMATISYNST